MAVFLEIIMEIIKLLPDQFTFFFEIIMKIIGNKKYYIILWVGSFEKPESS